MPNIMPRTARIVIPDVPHHVTHRGNNRQDIFFTYDDYAMYLNILRKHFDRYNLKLHAYCLMSNHVHLVVTPETEKSLAALIGKTHGHYTQYINKKKGTSGHLWENRFHSCPLDESHFIHAMRYTERNPVRVGLVDNAWDYPWSSASIHVSGEDPWGLIDLEEWHEFLEKTGLDWKEFIEKPEEDKIITKLRQHTYSGRPLGIRGQAPGFAHQDEEELES